MNLTFEYNGRSIVNAGIRSAEIDFRTNAAREPVHFDSRLLDPIRFREAISSLHDVVISDLRYKPRENNREAYEQWKRGQHQQERAIRAQALAARKKEIEQARRIAPLPDLERRYNKARNHYWVARQKYANYLLANDRDLWRLLMPCDPVVTVANDVVFYECFSADESTYGCLTVARDAFEASGDVQLGTTNVDYSWDLYQHFQKLRTYRDTRFRVAPTGIGVQTANADDYFEEKIDLPDGWLRGFLQVQASMSMPMRRVPLSRDAVYALLSHLRRHKERTSPRALRFELHPGRAPELVLEPWELRVASTGTIYTGASTAPIRIWGKRRLIALARILPLVDRFDVYLLGTGLPSFWVAHMGSMRLTLGLSGWTTNDWTRGSPMDQLAPPEKPTTQLVSDVAGFLAKERCASMEAIARRLGLSAPVTTAALTALAHRGQCIYDLHAGVHRWRSIMPAAVAEGQLGGGNEEAKAAQALIAARGARVSSVRELPGVGIALQGTVGSSAIELLLDADGTIRRGKCNCSHHFKNGLRMGPCRHLLALRAAHLEKDARPNSMSAWYEHWLRSAGGPSDSL